MSMLPFLPHQAPGCSGSPSDPMISAFTALGAALAKLNDVKD